MTVRQRLPLLWLMLVAAVAVIASAPSASSIWRVASLFAISVALLSGLRIVTGLSGLVSLAHVAIAGVGAYAAGLVASSRGVFGIDAIIAGTLAGAFAAMVVSIVSLRLDENYFAFATLAASEVFGNAFRGLTPVTGGANGLSGVPAFRLFGHTFDRPLEYVWPCIFGAVVSFVGLKIYERSRFGLALRAMSDEGRRVQCLGVHERMLRLTSFSAGGALAGFAGAFMAATDGFVGPESFGAPTSIIFLCFLVIGGGMASSVGVILAAFLATVGLEALRPLGQWQMIVVAAASLGLLIRRGHDARS